MLYRWTLDPAGGGVTETQLDDRDAEFPTHNETLTGRENRYLYTVSGDGVAKHDLTGGGNRVHATPGARYAGEAVFVPAADAAGEDEGWLLSLVSDDDGKAGELLVLDARDLSEQAVVELPYAVPAGFHGSWLPEPGTRHRTPSRGLSRIRYAGASPGVPRPSLPTRLAPQPTSKRPAGDCTAPARSSPTCAPTASGPANSPGPPGGTSRSWVRSSTTSNASATSSAGPTPRTGARN